MSQAIPHKIHRVWLGRAMPAEYKELGRTWERLHPGWEIRTWGDGDLDWLQNRRQFDEAERYTTKANIARYEIVHREGGLYVDCDFEALRPFDELLDGASLVVGEERLGLLNNALFAAAPGHPALAYAIAELPRSFEGLKGRHSIATTGPEFWTRCIRRWSAGAGEAPVVLGRDQLYPYGYDPGQRHLRHADFGDAFAVHHWADDAVPAAAPPAATTARLDRAELRRRFRVTSKHLLQEHVKPRVRSAVRRVAALALPLTWGTYAGHNRVLVRTASGLSMLTFADDLGVTPTLLSDGEYDPDFIAFATRILERGDVAVDVGANIGLFTVPMARAVGQTGRVFAYEPNPEVFSLLVDNVYLNRNRRRLGAEVRCRPVAAGRGAGSAGLRARLKHRGMGTLTGDGGPAPGDAAEHTVDVVVLDAELRGITEIKLVKVDVEGAELDVLTGMRRLLDERRVRYLDLELIDEHAGSRWPALADELRRMQRDLGGRFHRLGHGGALLPLDVEAALHHDELGHLVVELPRSEREHG